MMSISRNILVLCSVFTIVIVQSALADVYGLFSMIKDTQWTSVYSELAKKDFATLSGYEKHVFIAAAHLTDHNHIAFESRKKLTDADWADVQSNVGAPDGMYLEAGEATLNALIFEMHGDYNTAFKYCERAAKILDGGKRPEEMQQWEINKVVGQFGTIDGICAVIAYHDLLDRPAKFRTESALVTLGRLMRAADDLNKLEALIKDTTISNDSVRAAAKFVAPGEENNESADSVKKADAETIVSLVSRVESTSQTALFRYCKGNALRVLGKDKEALQEFSSVIGSDPACHQFWKAYLDAETNVKMIDVNAKVTKDFIKSGMADSNAILFIYDCQTALGKPKNAVSEFTKYLKKDPGNSIALAERGRAYLELKDIANASPDAAAAIAADSANFEAWYVLAMAAQANGDAKADEYFNKVIELCPKMLSMYSRAESALKD